MKEEFDGTTPPDANRLRLSKVKTTAAGIPAAISSMNHGFRKMGITKTVRNLLMVNQQEGFDCPGCAWPDPEHRTSFEFCENGAKAVADEAMKANVDAQFFQKYSVQELAQKSDFWLNKQGRIAQPMILRTDETHYSPIDWDDALALVASSIESMDSPKRGVYYTSGRTSNEAAFLYQALVRAMGTNNLPDCSNMCHESSGKALTQTIGIGKGTVHLEDFDQSDLILVIGQNPGTNHPRMLTALRDAKKSGAKIISINPLPETGLQRFKHPQDYMSGDFKSTQLADLYVPVRIGGDAALLKGVMKEILSNEALNNQFIATKTENFDAFTQALSEVSWERIVQDSGIERQMIQTIAEMCSQSNATIACWAMGLTQHKNGVAVIQEVVNLLLLGGHIGRPGAGVCPVRGHSNVQGDRTVGIWEAPSQSFLTKLKEGLQFQIPEEHGYDVVESIHAMEQGKVDVFVCMGGNFISATPDTRRTATSLRKVGLTVQISTKLNRSHLITGKNALILPVLGRTELDVQLSGEQFVTVENSMGIVHRSRGKMKPASQHLISESSLIARLGELLCPDALPWTTLMNDYDEIRNLMARSLHGFDDYNNRVRQPNGFLLPNPPRDSCEFHTPSGKASFTIHELPNVTLEEDRFVLMTIRSHDQYNTTIYGLHDRYRGVHGNRRVLFMNALDMSEHGLKTRDIVNITSHYGEQKLHSKHWILVPYEIPRRNLAAYFPEANELVPLESTADISNTPTSKWIEVSLSTSVDETEEE
ncbi:MAG: FdhF/YdeP family oxidoreductase [Candidatus Poseidoniaceae archaeon]